MRKSTACRLRIVASDFDGTIFSSSPKPGCIAPVVRKALEMIGTPPYQAARPVARVVVTGRNLRSLIKAFDSSVVEVCSLDAVAPARDASLQLCSHTTVPHNLPATTDLLGVWRRRTDSAVSERIQNAHGDLEGGSHFASNAPSGGAAVATAALSDVWNASRRQWLPIDYLICGSGSCVVDWHSLRVIETRALSASVAQRIAGILLRHNVSFFLLEGPPASHHCYVHIGADGGKVGDFPLRLDLYRDCTQAFDVAATFREDENGHARTFSQFVLICKDTDAMADVAELMREIQDDPHVRIVTLTSPGDGISKWIEILPCHVSKGDAIVALASHLIDSAASTLATEGHNVVELIGIGNDSNDADLLVMTSSADNSETGGVGYIKAPASPSGPGSKIHKATRDDEADVVVVPCGAYIVGDSTDALKEHPEAHRFVQVDRACRDGAVAEAIERAFEIQIFETTTASST